MIRAMCGRSGRTLEANGGMLVQNMLLWGVWDDRCLRSDVGMMLLEMDKDNVIGLLILSASVCISFQMSASTSNVALLRTIAAPLVCCIRGEVRGGRRYFVYMKLAFWTLRYVAIVESYVSLDSAPNHTVFAMPRERVRIWRRKS